MRFGLDFGFSGLSVAAAQALALIEYTWSADSYALTPHDTETTTDTHGSETSASGTASAISNLAGAYPWECFNKSFTGGDGWIAASGTTTGWIKYAFSSPIQLNTFRFYSPLATDGTIRADRQPKDFTIQVSNDGTNWTTVKTVTNATKLTTPQWSELYTISIPENSMYMKMDITANHGDATYLSMQELELNYQEVNNEVIVTNQGSSGATNNLQLNTAENIEVSSGQEFDVPVEADSACVMYHSITAKSMTYVTSISSPSHTMPQDTIGVIATLKTEPDTTDKTRLDAEPWQILNLWFEETTNLTSIVKADIQHLYNPNSLQGKYLIDLTVAKGSNLVTNGDFPTDVSGWTVLLASFTWHSSERAETGTNGLAYQSILEIGKICEVSLDVEIISGAVKVQMGGSGGLSIPLVEGNNPFLSAVPAGTSDSDRFYIGRNSSGAAYFDNVSVREIAAIEIPNYAASMYENVDFNKVGIQTTMLDIDGTGRTTAMVYDEEGFWAKGFGNTQFNPSSDASEWWLEEIIDGVVYQHKYDGVNLTTYTDNSSGGAGAHSPENADYLQGKGVYPKVAADPYTTYTLSHFMWWTGDGYTGYNQSDRYTEIS